MEYNKQAPWNMGRNTTFSRSMRVWLVLSAFLISSLSIGLFIYSFIKKREIDSLVQHENLLTQEVAKLDELNNQKKILETDAQQLDLRLTKIQNVICTTKNNPHQYLRFIEQSIPGNTLLSQFIFNRKNIRLEGLSSRIQEVTGFMRSLSKSKLVKSPRLITLDRNRKDGQIRFVIDVKKI